MQSITTTLSEIFSNIVNLYTISGSLIGGYFMRDRAVVKLIHDKHDFAMAQVSETKINYVHKNDLASALEPIVESIKDLKNEMRENQKTNNERFDRLMALLIEGNRSNHPHD